MITLRNRRILSVLFSVFCVLATWQLLQAAGQSLGDEAIMSGWTLLAAIGGLYLLSLRKRLVTARLGPVAAWLQMHVYLGTFACFVFLMHIGWPVRGIFESLLAGGFIFVGATGIILGLLSRSTPRRLSAIAQDYRLEGIPALQAALVKDAHRVAITAADFGEGATLAEYYQRRLLPFFQAPRSLLYVLLPTGFRRRQLLRELSDLDRYLAERGVASRQMLAALVQTKDDLDYHHALQSRLRLLYAAHVSLTWALALMIGVHVVMVYRFQGAF